MKRLLFLVIAAFPMLLLAQNDATALLDRAVAALNADAALQMEYTYSLYDEDGTLVQQDCGIMKLDGKRYSLLMENLKVWCDGKSQWSYMRDIDEIYITDAASDEAQNFSPLFIMEKYRRECAATMQHKGSVTVVTLVADSPESQVDKVVLEFDKSLLRLVAMSVYIRQQGYIDVKLNNYASKCSFSDSVYSCPVENFPTAEVVDMR